MLLMQYIGLKTEYQVNFQTVSDHIVEIKGNIPAKTKGFMLKREGSTGRGDQWDYSAYTAIYRIVEGGVQFSNNGSVYVEPVPKVSFYTNGGGTLDGETTQEVNDYSELVVPTPIANADYEFTSWSPEIPKSGEVKNNRTFTAIFTSTLPIPEPEPEPTLEERVAAVEEQNLLLSETVDSILVDVIPSL